MRFFELRQVKKLYKFAAAVNAPIKPDPPVRQNSLTGGSFVAILIFIIGDQGHSENYKSNKKTINVSFSFAIYKIANNFCSLCGNSKVFFAFSQMCPQYYTWFVTVSPATFWQGYKNYAKKHLLFTCSKTGMFML